MADRSAFCSRRCCSKFVPVFYFFGSSYHARARKHGRTHLQCQHFSVRRVCSKLFWYTRLALTVFFLKHDDVGKIQHVLSKASPSVKPQKKYAKKVRCAAVSRLLIGAWPASVVCGGRASLIKVSAFERRVLGSPFFASRQHCLMN